MRVYDRNVLPIELLVNKTLIFSSLTSWHQDCNKLNRLLKTLAAHFPACPASARRWVVLNLLALAFSTVASIVWFEMGHRLVAHLLLSPD
jgi:hypothetical protein